MPARVLKRRRLWIAVLAVSFTAALLIVQVAGADTSTGNKSALR